MSVISLPRHDQRLSAAKSHTVRRWFSGNWGGLLGSLTFALHLHSRGGQIGLKGSPSSVGIMDHRFYPRSIKLRLGLPTPMNKPIIVKSVGVGWVERSHQPGQKCIKALDQ